METDIETTRELRLLEHIEQDPDTTQAFLANKLGVAVGTVNWHLKRMIAKGYVKVKHAQRRKLRYIITPEGLAFRARLTVDYVEQSFRLYRRVRNRVREQLGRLKAAGHDSVYIDGDGDIADICRLTCLEQNIVVLNMEKGVENNLPVLLVNGMKVSLKLHEQDTLDTPVEGV